ncbi:unnamed protein product, partial [marine sediment metagenome]
FNPGTRFPAPPDFVWHSLQSVVIVKTPIEGWGTTYHITRVAWCPIHYFSPPHWLEFFFGKLAPGEYYHHGNIDETSRMPYVVEVPSQASPIMEIQYTAWDPWAQLYLQVSLHWPWYIRKQFRFPYERSKFQ